MRSPGYRCLTCDAHPRRFRGCCSGCYNRHWKAVKAKKTTWEALMAAGKVLPSITRAEAAKLCYEACKGRKS